MSNYKVNLIDGFSVYINDKGYDNLMEAIADGRRGFGDPGGNVFMIDKIITVVNIGEVDSMSGVVRPPTPQQYEDNQNKAKQEEAGNINSLIKTAVTNQ